jgi:hypothetical protein
MIDPELEHASIPKRTMSINRIRDFNYFWIVLREAAQSQNALRRDQGGLPSQS